MSWTCDITGIHCNASTQQTCFARGPSCFACSEDTSGGRTTNPMCEGATIAPQQYRTQLHQKIQCWTLCNDMESMNSIHCWCQVCEHVKCSCHACTCNAIAYAPAAAGNRFSKEGARRECVELITQAWTKDSQTCNVNLKFDERLASLGHYERNV